jgi:hypothetical protein
MLIITNLLFCFIIVREMMAFMQAWQSVCFASLFLKGFLSAPLSFERVLC